MATSSEYQTAVCTRDCGPRPKAQKGVEPPPWCRKKGHTLYRLRYRTPDGKQTDKRGFSSKREAEQFGNTVEVSKITGDFVQASAGRVTIGQLGEQWLEHRAAVTPKTRENDDSTWSAHVSPKWAHRAIGGVKKSEVRGWVAEMATAGVGVATIEKALGQLRQILDTATEDRMIARNPCEGVKAPRRKQLQNCYLTHAQVHQLAGEVADHTVVVLFLAYTGLRWGEMAALRVRHFDMLRRRVHVVDGVSEVKGKLVWGNVKDHERRSVPFPKFLAVQLATQMQGRGRDDLVFGVDGVTALRVSNYRDRVFSLAVARCTGAALRERATQARSKSGKVTTPEFPRVTPHDLRHTAASLAISAGANVKAVQTMLGHASAAMTLDTYADLFPDDLEAVAGALDKAARASVGKMWAAGE